MADWVLLGVALAAGFILGILVILPLRLRRRGAGRAAARTRPAARRDEVVPLEIVADDTPAPPSPSPAPARAQASPPTSDTDWQGDHFSIAKKPEGPQMIPREAGGVPTEWARRVVGQIEAGRVKGICSGCGTKLSVSMQRPLRIACPVCGRTRLLP